MNRHDIMQLIKYAVRDLNEAVTVYDAECEQPLPPYHSRESIKRRIVQIRQDLLMLEKEL